MPQSICAFTLTLTACSSVSGSTSTENYGNIPASADCPLTLTFLNGCTRFLFFLHNPPCHLLSPLLLLTSLSLTPHQSGGFRHRLWGGGSCGWGEVLVVQKQRFRQKPLRWRQPQELQVSTKPAAVSKQSTQISVGVWSVWIQRCTWSDQSK